jgi:hypothetical protein
VRDDRRLGPKGDVAACVITVPVSIQNEVQFLVSNSLESGANLVREWRKLIVNN